MMRNSVLEELRVRRFADKSHITDITVYTIYFHPQHTVPTASEKDNMVISYLTLNIISIKTVSSIAVSLTLGDYCFLYTIYHIQAYTLYHYPSTQLKLVSSFLYTILFYVSYVCWCVGLLFTKHYNNSIYCAIILCLLLYLSFIFGIICTWTLFSFYARPYVFTFYVTMCECHIALN